MRWPLEQWLLLAVAGIALPLFVGCPESNPGTGSLATRPPNVMLVVLDTTRSDILSCYGYSKPTTPTLDRLASEGTLFTNAHATDFWTLPSHASLLTGQYPSRHQATSETNRLPGQAETLAESLRRAGYRTAAFVSNVWVSRERGFHQGFETFEEMWAAGTHDDTYSFDKAGTRAARTWLDRNALAGKPFFLFVNFNTAHLPYSPTPLALVELTPGARPLDRVARLRQVKSMWSHLGGELVFDEMDFQILNELYEAEVNMVDSLVGKLVDELEEQGVLDDTLVIITSDHGENIGDHGMIDHLLSMHETTIRIPLIIRFPARFPPGSIRSDLVSQVNIAPTVIDVAGLAARYRQYRHRSLAQADAEPPAFVIAENERPINGIELMKSRFPDFDVESIDHRIRMLRTNRHKLIWHSNEKVELFDLKLDPAEEVDIAASRPELRDRLILSLMQWMRPDCRCRTRRTLLRRDVAADGVDHAAGAIAALDLDGNAHGGLDGAVLHLLDLHELAAAAHPGAHGNGSGEAQLVGAVVDPHGDLLHLHDLGQEEIDQGLGEISVGDALAEGAVLGALGVDVDPLMVAGGIGELVDARLVDLEPVAVAEVLSYGSLEVRGGLEYGSHALSSS